MPHAKIPHLTLPVFCALFCREKTRRRTLMKRSEINKALRELEAMCAREHCYLPPFCSFAPEEWKSKGHEYDEHLA